MAKPKRRELKETPVWTIPLETTKNGCRNAYLRIDKFKNKKKGDKDGLWDLDRIRKYLDIFEDGLK